MTKRCRLGGVLKRMQGQGQGLLLLAHLLTLSYVEFCIDAELIDSPSGSTMGAPVSSQSVRWSPVAHFEITTETSGPLMLTNALPMHKGHTEHLSTESSSSRQTFSPAQAPDYGSLVAVGHASLSSSHISIASLKQNRHSSPNPGLSRPPTLGASPPGIADGSMPPTSAQAPEPPSISGCCGPNMVQRRGSLDCHCVYPIKVELYLWNVSLSSNWRDEFLNELASQLNLRVSQFEIENFYVVGTSGLNITMDVTPHTGISFSANEASAVNNSLTYHSVRIDPSLVGSYKLLNLTHFMPPPSPAPASAASPNSLPHLSSPVHKSSNEHGSNKLANIILVLGICAGAAIITSVVTICYCKSDRGKKAMPEEMAKAPSVDVISMEGSFAHPSSTRFLAYEELKEATNNFEASSMLGEGGFGRVFRGVLADGTAVAIKKLTSGGHQGDKEFLVEVQMLSRLHHRNLVKLIGYYTSRESSQNLLCYELVPNGSLEAWLHGPLGVNCPLDWDTRMKIALDAARGLAYLHEDSQPCVIHRDFKASNILLENDFHAKVSDFGLAKHAPEGRTNYLSTRVMGTFGYVAPEYAMTGHLLVKSDVYSYGVVLLELLTGKKPVDMSQPSGQENLVAWARPILRDREHINDLADPRLNGKCPKEDFVRVCIIAAACVAPEASQRPTMGEVVQSLKMVQHVTEYKDSTSTSATTARPNIRPSSSAYESDDFSSMFSSGPFSGLSLLDNDNVSRTAMFSEDLHEGR